MSAADRSPAASTDGSFDRAVESPSIAPETPIEAGSKVRIVAGRYRSAVGELVGISDVPTPSGSTVKVACVRRPRAGSTLVFSHEIEPA